MTLRARLLLSALVLSLATTFVLSLVLRSAWQKAEAQRFEQEFQEAVAELIAETAAHGKKISAKLQPLCDHDPIVDSALVGIQSGTLNSRLLSLRTRLPELGRALGLSELALVSSQGVVLAGSTAREAQGAQLAEHVRGIAAQAGFRQLPPQAFEGACLKSSEGSWVALLGATSLQAHLERASESHDLALSLIEGEPPRDDPATWVAHVQLPSLGGATLLATRSRQPLRAQLRDLDAEVATAALVTLSGALVLAALLSRGLAQPVVAFAKSTREAISGRVHELPETGGPELAEAARAFNATLADLRELRGRVAKIEKIAARREVARQIAHEIKNPLSPIRTSLETLQKLHARGHPEFDRYFGETTQTMLREVERLTAMVSHFARYAKLPSPTPRELDLLGLLQEIIQLHAGLSVPIELDGQRLEPARVDRDQIAQVLTNLLKNALEATRGVPHPRVQLRLRRGAKPRLQVIEVEDNGAGIASPQLERLFEPYATTKKDGTGLGLPISHRIAVEHGGDLTYRMAPSGGALFQLTLPTDGPPDLGEAPKSQRDQPV